jgi:hypothetical protein
MKAYGSSRPIHVCIVAVCVGILGWSNVAEAQQRKPSRPQPTLSGNKPWVVYRFQVLAFRADQMEDLADFDTEEEARADALRRKDEVGFWSSWQFDFRKRKTEDIRSPETVNGVRFIQKPELRRVELPRETRGDGTPLLVGRKGFGKIGPLNAQITFADGTFSVLGDVNGEGEWRQFGNLVVLRTQTAEYRGTINGNTIIGERRFLNGQREPEKWSFELEALYLVKKLGNSKFPE